MGEADARYQWESAGGSAPDHWDFCFFSDLLETPTSITVGVMYPGGDTPNGIPLVKVTDVKNGQIQAPPTYCVSSEVDEQYKKTRLNGTELLITLVGEPGDCVVVDPSMDGWNVARALAVARLKDPNIRSWIRHVLLSAPAKHLIDARLNTTVQKTLNLKDVKQLGIPLPPKEERDSISSVVASLDDKIELNRRMNATLEGMAQALFKSWFVDFDPVIDNALAAGNPIPDELAPRAEVRKKALASSGELSRTNGTTQQGSLDHPTLSDPKSLFPDAFQFTEELGWIPEGWEVGSFLDEANLLSGGTPKTSEPDYWNGEIKWASAKDVSQCGKAFLIETEKTITALGLDKSSTKIIPQFSTVVVARGATTGRMTMFGEDIAMNQTCYGMRMKSGNHFYGYCHAKNLITNLVNAAHGSVFDTITTATFMSSKVLKTPLETSELFEEAASPIFSKILASQKEAGTLTKLRDALLPKLVSGQLQSHKKA